MPDLYHDITALEEYQAVSAETREYLRL